jgi:hypothetical protein
MTAASKMQANPFGGIHFGKKKNSITKHHLDVVKMEHSQKS